MARTKLTTLNTDMKRALNIGTVPILHFLRVRLSSRGDAFKTNTLVHRECVNCTGRTYSTGYNQMSSLLTFEIPISLVHFSIFKFIYFVILLTFISNYLRVTCVSNYLYLL